MHVINPDIETEGVTEMKSLKILGPSCENGSELILRAVKAANSLNLEYRLEKIMDQEKIMGYGVIVTPALVIDDHVRFTGNLPSVDEIKKALS